VIFPKQHLNTSFVRYLLSGPWFKERLSSLSRSCQTGFNRDDLQELYFPLPPLAEQHRIVANLDYLFEKHECNKIRLEKIPIILKRFRQSVLAAAVSGRLTNINKEIEKIPLGELIDDLKYGTAEKSEKDKKGTPILRIPNIGDDGRINLNDLKFAELQKKELEKLALKEGDILLIRSNGSVSLLGKAAIVSSEQVGLAYAGYLIRIRCNLKKVLPEFLNHVLSSYDVRMQIEIPSRSSSGVNNINSDEVRALQIPVFTIDEQKEIVKIIRFTDENTYTLIGQTTSDTEHVKFALADPNFAIIREDGKIQKTAGIN
jgi:type I restriction enzyme S subunit